MRARLSYLFTIENEGKNRKIERKKKKSTWKKNRDI